MANNLKWKNPNLEIEYQTLLKPKITTGFPFAIEQYETDSEGNLTKAPLPLINATDINWGNASLNDYEIESTDDLLYLLKTSGVGAGDGLTIDSNSILGMMLKSIRVLQAEVRRLRNSIVDGIYSYTGKQTKISKTIHDYSRQEIDAQEPLWAIDESTLSELVYVDLNTASDFIPNDNIQVNSEANTLKFNSLSTWYDSQNILSTQTDPKIYVYLKSTGLDITFHLIAKDNEDKIIEGSNLDIKLSNYFNSNSGHLYNILFTLATSVKKSEDSDELVGPNFIWIQVEHYIYDGIQQGYYDLINNQINKNEVLLDKRYILQSIDFNGLTLSKFHICSRYQNFSNEVESMNPDDPNDRYKVAHITIRSIDTYEDLIEIKDELPENELIYVEKGNTLYIKNGYKIKKLGLGGTNPDPEIIDTMTNKELLTALKNMGIVYEHWSEDPDTHDYNLDLAALDSVTFIHQATGKKFDISVNAYGKLESVEQLEESLTNQLYELSKTSKEDETDEERLSNLNKKMKLLTPADPSSQYIYNGPNENGVGYDIRGFHGKLNFNFATLDETNIDFYNKSYQQKIRSDFKLNSDRIRIASIYAPLNTDKAYGCSHGFIEIENTSDKDFYLDGCTIFYTNQRDIYSLDLTGYIPKGGTYLIRCKQFADPKLSSNVFINVETYDIEWWIDGVNGKELLDTSIKTSDITSYALVHLDETLTKETMTSNTPLFVKISDTLRNSLRTYFNDNKIDEKGQDSNQSTSKPEIIDKLTYCYDPHLIDAVTFNKENSSKWSANNFKTLLSNSIYKNTFELDPAKQAYNAFNMYESSRVRWNKPGTDSQTLELNKEYIEFYHTTEKKAVKDYTPKASFEHKNVCTDKTQLDMEKPNMPTVSFGIDIFKTRCFNWISCGLFDEYVFIKNPDAQTWPDGNIWKSFASYTTIESLAKMPAEKTEYPRKYEYTNKTIADGYTSLDINNSTYARFTFNLPANGTQITSHKCIVDIRDSSQDIDTPKVYIYIVGRADKTGKAPDFEHCSKELTFTIYPKSYIPRIYQITDQQGFHWIEYQAWGAAALKVLDKINADQATENIIPILINTGDAVQAGCRINEWLDYYKGGECLFDHLEQMEIVGNNDLCMTDYTKLGTGDDEGKSNSFFYSLFYCYQMDPAIPTLIKGLDENQEIKYIPSLYYFEYNNGDNKIRFINVNSEITYVNAKDWFKLEIPNTNGKYIINPYNGYCLSNDNTCTSHEYIMDSPTDQDYQQHNLVIGSNTQAVDGVNRISIYEMIYRMLQINKTNDNTKYVVACHEMPFTVITDGNIKTNKKSDYRSANGSSLVGSHLNQLIASETGNGTYWFSRLLEYKGVKLCIGGHKHTYCYTYPLRENYLYNCTYYTASDPETQGDSPTKYIGDLKTFSLSTDNPQVMKQNLKNDSISWIYNGENTSKKPITKRSQTSIDNIIHGSEYILPISVASQTITNGKVNYTDENNFVIYFMCQATGYKLTSNKELPTPLQAFTQVLPKTSPGAASDSPNANQKYPMFAIIAFDDEISEITIKNIRITNIYLRSGSNTAGKEDFDPYGSTFNFNQQKFATADMELQYLVDIDYFNNLYWKNNSYGTHFDKLDQYNKNYSLDKTNTSNLSSGKIQFDNYGVWTSEETIIDNPITL